MRILAMLSILLLGAFGASQTFDTFFSGNDLAALEQLIAAAQENDAAVLATLAQIEVLEQSASFEGRLTESLSISAGAGLEGNLYDQATTSYSITVSIDVMNLIDNSDTRRILDIQLAAARAEARVRAVEAFVGYKVAANAAEAAARGVEASEAVFQVTAAQYNVGDAILANQITAQSAVAEAAVGLLTANGQVIVALERLASVTGLAPREVSGIVGGDTTQANR